MPDHTTITNLGAVKAQSIAYDNTKAAIAIPQVSTADTFTTLNATQTLTNKTLTTPVIASFKQASNGGTMNVPSVAVGLTESLATSSQLIAATGNMVTTNTAQTITGQKTFSGDIHIVAGTAGTNSIEFTMGQMSESEGSINHVEFTRNFPAVEGNSEIHATAFLPVFTENQALVLAKQTQVLENKTLTTPIISSLKQANNGGTINMPTVASGQTKTLATTDAIPSTSNMVTTDTAQTITGQKTLTTPVIASLKQASNGGTINMPTVASGQTKTLATTDAIPSVSNMVTTDTVQNITAQKAFLAPVICGNGLAVAIGTGTTDELQFRVGNSRGDTCAFFERNATINGEETSFTLSVPTFSQNDVLAKVSELTALQNSVASATDFNTLKTIMTNLLSYLRDWIQVGNLTMNDVVVQSDPANYLHLRQADPS